MSLEGWTGLSVGLPKAERTTILYSESDTRRLAETEATAKVSKGRAQSPLAAPAGAVPPRKAEEEAAGCGRKPFGRTRRCGALFLPQGEKEYHPKGDPHAELFV